MRWSRLAHADSPPLPLPLAADDPDGIVVHVRSLTKAAASPSLRIGALSARGPVLERLRAIQVVDSLFVPRPLQETALELVGSPAWTSHLLALASALRDRRTTLLTALSGALPTLLPHTSHHAVDTICGCGCPTVPTSTPSPRPPCAAAWRSPPAAPTYFVQINLAPGLAGVPLGPLVAERTAMPTYIELHSRVQALATAGSGRDEGGPLSRPFTPARHSASASCSGGGVPGTVRRGRRNRS